MGAELYIMILIAAVIFAASYVQSVTGFAFGIIAMIFLPYFLLYTEANLLSSILSTITSLFVVLAMYKKINWKNLIFPLIGSFIMNYLSVAFMKSSKNETLILLLGIALFLLSIYFFFFSDKVKIKPSWYSGLIAGSISGIMSGLFSIGGPPVVIYYMQSEEDTDSYLATISIFFVLSGIVSSGMKIASGFMTPTVLLGLLIGGIGMLIGAFLGKLTRKKAEPKIIKKAVYGVMAVSGAINIVTSLI
jgi:uncharacterized membrane protein YfcA